MLKGLKCSAASGLCQISTVVCTNLKSHTHHSKRMDWLVTLILAKLISGDSVYTRYSCKTKIKLDGCGLSAWNNHHCSWHGSSFGELKIAVTQVLLKESMLEPWQLQHWSSKNMPMRGQRLDWDKINFSIARSPLLGGGVGIQKKKKKK